MMHDECEDYSRSIREFELYPNTRDFFSSYLIETKYIQRKLIRRLSQKKILPYSSRQRYRPRPLADPNFSLK